MLKNIINLGIFIKDLSVDQIELSMRKDTVWDRPSWPLKGNPNKSMESIK